jgi:hypothetical protein
MGQKKMRARQFDILILNFKGSGKGSRKRKSLEKYLEDD